MKNDLRRMMPAVLLALAASLPLSANARTDDKKDQGDKPKSKYAAVEVVRFDVKEGVEITADYLITLTEELVSQLQGTKLFNQVMREGENPSDPAAPSLKLVGTITEFKAGSRAKRYLIGFGAGKTKIKAHIKLVDRSTGEVVLERDVDGNVVIGAMGGDSIGATRGLAKEVAKETKKKLS